ncbi:hypothetical protein [Maritalea sp.]|uniref:hypothetical protein n=1 Tax=Maritalea sp. TaxID=2003361 RepID=UPI003EF43F21
MTNQRACANAPIRQKLTREDMQRESLIVESLLSAAQAMSDDDDISDMLTMIEMAQARATGLTLALDSINALKVVS